MHPPPSSNDVEGIVLMVIELNMENTVCCTLGWFTLVHDQVHPKGLSNMYPRYWWCPDQMEVGDVVQAVVLVLPCDS